MKIEVTKPESGETLGRIRNHLLIAKDPTQKREISLTWDGYIAALLEWGLLSPEEHGKARDLMRENLRQDDPSSIIFNGIPEKIEL